MKIKKISMSMVEYAILISVISVSLILISSYVKRGLMYKYKEVGDSIGHGRQYSGRMNLDGIDP